MRRPSRRVVGLIVLVVILIVALLPRLIPAERWKRLAIARIEKSTGLEVSAAGAHLSFPWPIGLQLEDLRVTDPRERTGLREFEADITSALVEIEWKPLLHRTLEARQIRVDGAHFAWTDPKGPKVELSDLSARAAMRSDAQGTTLEVAELQALGLRSEGTVHWVAAERDAEISMEVAASLEELMKALRASGLAPEVDFETTGLTTLQGSATARVRGEFALRGDSDWALRVLVDRGRVEGLDYSLPEEGGRLSGSPTFRADYRTDSASTKAQKAGEFHYEIDAAGLQLRPAQWTESLVADSGKVSGGLESARVESLGFDGAGIEGGRAVLTVNDLATQPHTTGSVRAASVDLARLQRAAGVSKEQGTTWVLSDLRGSPDLLEGHLQMKDCTAKIAGGEIQGGFDYDMQSKPPAWSAKLDGGRFETTPLLDPFAPTLANALKTTLTGDATIAGVASEDPAQRRDGLSGNFHLLCDAGTLATSPVLGDRIAEFLGPNSDRWRELKFRALDAGLKVEKGRVNFDRVLLQGDTEVTLGGSIGLDGTNDYRLDVRLPKGVLPQLGSLSPLADLLKDDTGRFAFGVNVRGTARRPSVEIDFADLEARAKEAGRSKAEEGVRDALDRLGDKLRGKH